MHAGWRGIAAGVVPATARRMGGSDASCSAWIGPAIGPCCYEVGDEVARAVVGGERAGGDARRAGAAGRTSTCSSPSSAQLRAAGVAARARRLGRCTALRRRSWLWSYRRDGAAGGRNLALIRLTG